MSNYPPGVTGNEPQITGEWPCDDCGGRGYDEDEDGKFPCRVCEGKGFITFEEEWATSTYICDCCGEASVEMDGSGGFSCTKRCDPDAHWHEDKIINGELKRVGG